LYFPLVVPGLRAPADGMSAALALAKATGKTRAD
jgi:hypothetical protein